MRSSVIVALILVLGVTVALLAAPVYGGSKTSYDPERGAQVVTETKATLIEINGAVRAVLLLSVPLVLSALPLFWPRHTTVSGICLLFYALLSGGSVGVWYIPSALLLMFASAMGRAERVEQ